MKRSLYRLPPGGCRRVRPSCSVEQDGLVWVLVCNMLQEICSYTGKSSAVINYTLDALNNQEKLQRLRFWHVSLKTILIHNWSTSALCEKQLQNLKAETKNVSHIRERRKMAWKFLVEFAHQMMRDSISSQGRKITVPHNFSSDESSADGSPWDSVRVIRVRCLSLGLIFLLLLVWWVSS